MYQILCIMYANFKLKSYYGFINKTIITIKLEE